MKRAPRILITTGGTGGHVFPALALADELIEQGCQIMFAGGKLSKNPYFETERYVFQEVKCGQLQMSPWQCCKEIFTLTQGLKESMLLIKNFNPDLVMGFGSHYTFPVVAAATLMRKRVFLHEANSIPGRVNRWLAPFVEKTWLHFPSAKHFVKGSSAYGGMPLRSNYRKGLITQEDALGFFQLSPHLLTILVFGGSQGAKKINSLFCEAALRYLKKALPPFQVLHFTGNHAESVQVMKQYALAEIPAYVLPFEKRMDLAWAAADLAVTRAGAASIAEQMEYEVPGILIPYPFATDQHQDKNADYLIGTGLVCKVPEANLTAEILSGVILDCYQNRDRAIEKFKEYKKQHCNVSLSKELITLL